MISAGGAKYIHEVTSTSAPAFAYIPAFESLIAPAAIKQILGGMARHFPEHSDKTSCVLLCSRQSGPPRELGSNFHGRRRQVGLFGY